MEINVKVVLEIGESSKKFLEMLFSGMNPTPSPAPEAPRQEAEDEVAVASSEQREDEPKAKKSKKAKAPESTPAPELAFVPESAPEPASEPAQEPAQEPEEAEAPSTETQSEDDLKQIFMKIRDEVAAKSMEHSEVIKAKLAEMGTKVLPKLDPSKFQEFYDFVKSL